MKNLKKLFLFFCLITVCNLFVYAQVNKKDTLAANQVTIGIGPANGFENHIFNVSEDEAVKTTMALNLSYIRFLDRNIGIGARIIGYTKTIDNLMIQDNNGRIFYPKFNLSVISLCAEGVYMFGWKNLQPYGSLYMGYTGGTVESEETGSLNLSGFSIGGALGARYLLSNSWAISLELNGILGTSSWDETPFLNSTGKEFNPSMVSVLAGISYLW